MKREEQITKLIRDVEEKNTLTSGSLISFFILLLFLAGTIYLVRFSPVKENFSLENIELVINGYGAFGPIAYMLFVALGVFLSLPATPFEFVGAVVFGITGGFIYSIVGVTLGSCAAFMLARRLGKRFVQRILGKKVGWINKEINKGRLKTLIAIRFIPILPSYLVNPAAGLTKIKLSRFALGSFIGMMPPTFLNVYLFCFLGRKLLSEPLALNTFLDLHVIIPIILYLGVFSIPAVFAFKNWFRRWKAAADRE